MIQLKILLYNLGGSIKITDYLAIYGAVLSTLVFIWNYVRTLPRVRIKIIYSSDGAVASIQNPSNSAVHITAVSFLYPYGDQALLNHLKHIFKYKRYSPTINWCHSSLSISGIDSGCPITIDPGKSHIINIPEKAIHRLLKDSNSKSFKIVTQDALWRNTYSSKFNYEY